MQLRGIIAGYCEVYGKWKGGLKIILIRLCILKMENTLKNLFWNSENISPTFGETKISIYVNIFHLKFSYSVTLDRRSVCIDSYREQECFMVHNELGHYTLEVQRPAVSPYPLSKYFYTAWFSKMPMKRLWSDAWCGRISNIAHAYFPHDI